ncbi:MAG: MarR family transcriptional regulator [Spirochaetes bacterium]|nr:MarR family transcriptional regulator [Spirochaetota bacterium]
MTEFIRKLSIQEKKLVECCGVTLSQYLVLITLLGLKDISISNLSKKMGLDGSTMSRNIDLLYRKGLVERFRDEETDRRIVYVKLSEAGGKTAGDVRDGYNKWVAGLWNRVKPEARPVVAEALKSMIQGI